MQRLVMQICHGGDGGDVHGDDGDVAAMGAGVYAGAGAQQVVDDDGAHAHVGIGERVDVDGADVVCDGDDDAPYLQNAAATPVRDGDADDGDSVKIYLPQLSQSLDRHRGDVLVLLSLAVRLNVVALRAAATLWSGLDVYGATRVRDVLYGSNRPGLARTIDEATWKDSGAMATVHAGADGWAGQVAVSGAGSVRTDPPQSPHLRSAGHVLYSGILSHGRQELTHDSSVLKVESQLGRYQNLGLKESGRGGAEQVVVDMTGMNHGVQCNGRQPGVSGQLRLRVSDAESLPSAG
ncbi:hypothetical protein BGZ58_003416 [Dissophora ornata]|nr:hypothetical protein BGZ58_003416 [Dissophora ornata]